MIETDLAFCENDLKETYFSVAGKDDIPVRHIFSEKENKVVNTVVVGGKAYAYGNLLIGYKDETDKKRLIKRYAKLSVYKALSAFTGKNLPWGSLTGVRPTKLAYDEIEKNGDFTDFFINTMKVSPEKTELVRRVIENQKGIYGKDVGDDFFIFVPFCPSRCNYCSFITHDLKNSAKMVNEYLENLFREIDAAKELVKNLRSIYVGGGTPVSLDDGALDELLSTVKGVGEGTEFTVEAGRPDRITESNLSILKKHGVNRICINPQTFNDETLKRIGRNHTGKDIIDKYSLAKNDFSVNMDLIAGLDGECFEDFKKSLDTAVDLSPDGITVHTLSVKAGATLSEKGKYRPAGEIGEMVEYAHKTLTENGYKPYYMYRQKYMTGGFENTGYSKDGKFSVYNIDTMEEIGNNIACGAGAVSKAVNNAEGKIVRYGNPKDIKTYIEKTDAIIAEKAEIFR